ncbi:MAG: TonB-dependent receptor domain-containing protein, partial [Blastocatellia bacterium]
VEERGLNGSGAEGVRIGNIFAYPTSLQGSAIFSLFPFPNNPNGIYGRKTFTQILPGSAQGNVASVKLDHSFKFKEREHSLTGRYNRTDDWHNIPAAGGALFGTLRPVVRTHNVSLFLNSELSGPNAITPIFNQFRASYGRTRLLFEEERDTEHLIPSGLSPNEPFLLNAPFLINVTSPNQTVNYVQYITLQSGGRVLDAERGRGSGQFGGALGPLGQVLIAGYSPLGVDVYSFPQRRVNNTYQLADTLTMRVRAHSLSLGGDFRRTDLNSDLPRNARPLLTFGSTPAVDFDANGAVRIDPQTGANQFSRFISPVFAAAAAAPNNMSQALAREVSSIGLRYYQINLFAQDEWRARPNLSLSFGLRYEYNTPPSERRNLIEKTFKDPQLSLVPGLQKFLENRDRIFDPDRNNFAPRVGLAFARNIFGTNATSFRGGYGLFHDQVLGAVVSLSRNVFPNFLTLNTGGGLGSIDGNNGRIGGFDVFNTASPTNGICFGGDCVNRFFPFAAPGTLNRLNEPNITLNVLTDVLNRAFPGEFGFTLPAKNLPTPMAHQYSFTIEQELGLNWVASAAYVGTQGRNLLRLTTPNLGPNLILPGAFFDISTFSDAPNLGLPLVYGYRLTPGQTLKPTGVIDPPNTTRRCTVPNHASCLKPTGTRPTDRAGTIYLYQTNAESRYDSLQLQLRGRLRNDLQLQVAYTFAKALDDVSDVFDLAGASSLPQDNSRLDLERGPANFDARHRFAAYFNYLFPTLASRSRASRLVLGGFELAGTWQYQTGQPFTVNSLFDINFDGNYTDRLNTTQGLMIDSGNDRQPLRLSVDNSNPNLVLPFLAPFNQNGRVGRNTFRAGDYFVANLALIKNFAINERHRIIFRTEAFNLFDRSNFGIPVRYLEAPAFGQATETVTPGRRIQFALKYSF